MGYMPNPFAVGALKIAAYSGFGWSVGRRWPGRQNAFLFASVRVGCGLLVTIAFAAVLDMVGARHWSERGQYVLLQVPRLALWVTLLRYWFRVGGRPLLVWTVVGAGVSLATDLIIFRVFDQIPWLQVGIC